MNKPMIARDSKYLCVFDDKMKHGIPSAIPIILSVMFLVALTVVGFCAPLLSKFFDWIDSRGHVIGIIIVLFTSCVFGLKWVVNKIRK